MNLDNDYSLNEEQIAAYQRDGHVLIRGLVTPEEMGTYRPILLDAAARFNTEKRALSERDTYGKAFLQIMNLWQLEEKVRNFVLSRRFAKVAAQLMQVDGIRLYHDQALFKEAGGGSTPWHQDQHYWPLDTNNTITMWMPLVDATTDMGTMHFASGSHELGYLGDLPISDKSEAQFDAFLKEKGYPINRSGSMTAGDATFHSGWTLHGAPGNSSGTMREVMTIIYFADGVKVGHADNPNRQSDLNSWLPGLKPGDVAASELNPLVYSA